MKSEIKQFFISDSIKFFRQKVAIRHKLKCVNESGYDIDAPCLFVGNYRPLDLMRINNHNGFALIHWTGYDVLLNSQVKGIKKEVSHIAESHWIENALRRHGVEFKFIPISLADLEYWIQGKSEPLGNCVYSYAPNERYNLSLVKEIGEMISYKLFLLKGPEFSQPKLYEIYKQCFIGLRLTEAHDGNSVTVQEMGLMGRRTIYNGENPSAIHIEGPVPFQMRKREIVDIIKAEASKIGTTQAELAEKVYKFFDIGRDWLTVDYWR